MEGCGIWIYYFVKAKSKEGEIHRPNVVFGVAFKSQLATIKYAGR